MGSQDTAILLDIDPRLYEAEFGHQINENAIVRDLSATSTKRKDRVDGAILARNWGIGLEAAAKTVEVTTQRGARTTLHPSLV
jgi:hypothetical protein